MYSISATSLAVLCCLHFGLAVNDEFLPSDYGSKEHRELDSCQVSVTGFDLISTRSNEVLSSLPYVVDYNNATCATGLNIVARTTSCQDNETAQSMMLEFDDPPVSICDNLQEGVPFSVFGSTTENNLTNFSSAFFPLGYRTVRATPYLDMNCTGLPAQTLSQSFEVQGCLDGFNFYDADTNELFTGNLANPPCNINIEATISENCAFPVNSILLQLTDFDDNIIANSTAIAAPYLLYGKSDANILSGHLQTGFYRITAFLNGENPSRYASFTTGECRPSSTTAVPTSVVTTTAVPTTAVSTTAVPSSAVPTAAARVPTYSVPTHDILSASDPTTAVPHFSVVTTVPTPTEPTTAVPTTATVSVSTTAVRIIAFPITSVPATANPMPTATVTAAPTSARLTNTVTIPTTSAPAPEILIADFPKPSVAVPTTTAPTTASPGCTDISINSILGLDSPLFEVGDTNVIDLIYTEYQAIVKGTAKGTALDFFVFPPEIICADSNDTVNELGYDAGVDACKKLNFLGDTDVLAFGLEADAMGFCAAINPFTNTYAIAQKGILPPVTIEDILTLTLDAVGFSLTKQLSKKTLNKMWDGTSSPGYIDVFGHAVVLGKGSIGIELSSQVTCAIEIAASLVVDADYKNDGLANIFSGTSETIDFAILVSGSVGPAFEISGITDGEDSPVKVDLAKLLHRDTDLYLIVDGDNTALQLASSISVTLDGICEASKYLEILCKVFDGTFSLSGVIQAYARNDAFGLRFAIEGEFAFSDDFLNELVGWGDDGVSFSASLELKIAGDNVVACATISDTIIDDWCIGTCESDTDCAAPDWCAVGFCFPCLDDGTLCGLGTTCDHCCSGVHDYWLTKAFTACGQEPCLPDDTVCGAGTTCDKCCNKAYNALGTQCGGECWGDGTECGAGTTCDLCCNGSEYWYSKSFTACGQEPCFPDDTVCGAGTTCNKCCNKAYNSLGTQCGGECWEDGTTCGEGTTCDLCCNKAYNALGTECGGECWTDGTICAEGTTCDLCCNGSEYWYSKGFTACGKEACWDDGTVCAVGTTCNACCNADTYWWGKAITACGEEPCWSDGTVCAVGTTCDACCNTNSYWLGKAITACGTEPCWSDGTVCGVGTTCNKCCNKAINELGTQCGGTCWGDGTSCAEGTTCNLCCNGSEYWFSKGFTACGREPCWSDGTICADGSTCNSCCNGSGYWYSKAFTACGQEPCWGSGTYCLDGTTCNRCCRGAHWSWSHFSFYCN